MSYYGLSASLIIYLTKVLHQDVTSAAKNVNYWTGVTILMPLLGGFVADSYLGRFSTVFISSVIYILGLGLLTMSQFIPAFKPNVSIRRHQLIFFIALYLISVGTGGHKPALESFGADQFDGNHSEERKQKMSYFNWWNAAVCAGVIFGVTVIVYVQDNVGWGAADVILMLTMAFSLAVFCSGRRYYRYYVVPEDGPFVPLLQVVTAAIAKRHLTLPSDPSDLHEIPTLDGTNILLRHTKKLSFLDKAAIVEAEKGGDRNEEEGGTSERKSRRSSWRLTTVSQVEDLKLIIWLIPIWLTTQPYGLIVAQSSTFFIKQCSVMNRKLTASLEIPAASMFVLGSIGMISSISIYDKIVVPFLRSITGNERGMSILRRIGIGMVISNLAVAIAALVENRRLMKKERSEIMNVFWLVPQFFILGFGDGLALVGLQEYFYEQIPNKMRSLGIAFYLSVIGCASFSSGFLIDAVGAVTRRIGTNDSGWFGKDLNSSRLDYFYWLLVVINGLNIFVYAFVSRNMDHRSILQTPSQKPSHSTP